MISKRHKRLYQMVNEALYCIELQHMALNDDAEQYDMTAVLTAQLVECITGYAQTREQLSDACERVTQGIYEGAALVWSIENGDEDQ